MIDWLSSKVAMTLAALFLLAGVVGFFVAQRDRAIQDGLQAIADEAAAYIGEVSRSAGTLSTSISVGSPADPRVGAPEGLELPARAAGQSYLLVLHRSHLIADDGGRHAEAGLRVPVHLWRPAGTPYSAEEVAALDARNTDLSIGPGQTVALRRQALEVDGTPAFETFAYL